MYEQILNSLLTKNDLDILRSELRLLENTNYKFGDEGLGKVLSTDIRQKTSEIIREDMRKNNVTSSEYVKGLLLRLKGYQSIELTVPFEPTEKNMENISDWVTGNIGENTVIEYRYNPYLIGGAIVVSKGEYRNFSLSKLIDTFFEKDRGRIDEILSR